MVLEQTGREIAQVFSSIDGVAGMLNPKQDRPQTLTHLRIVLSASELAMLPFEASKVPTGTGAGSVWLALQARARSASRGTFVPVSAEGVLWPATPRILFIAGPETPAGEHRAVLETALKPWRAPDGSVAQLLRVLERPKVADINRVLSEAVAKRAPFTHVHVLAHGTQINERDRYSPVGLILSDDEDPVSGDRLATALTSVRSRAPTGQPSSRSQAAIADGRWTSARRTPASHTTCMTAAFPWSSLRNFR